MTSAFTSRAARVLIALYRTPDGLRLSDLAALNRIPLSSAQRILGALSRDGLVVRSGTRRPAYRLASTAPAATVKELASWRLSPAELAEVESFLAALRSPAQDGLPHDLIDLPESVREIRRQLLTIVVRRAHPGAGSDLRHLQKEGLQMLAWWASADAALKGVPHAVFGAVGAMRYMPARTTGDLDLAVQLADLPRAEEGLRQAGWKPQASLQLYGGLVGRAWVDASKHELDVVGLPGRWGGAAIAGATYDRAVGMRSLTLPYAVLTKMISSRTQDISDLSRMLGSLSEARLATVLAVVRQHLSGQDAEDAEQIAALGRLEVRRAGRK